MLRLRNATDFERVRREGRSHAHPFVVLISCRSNPPDAPSRCGFAAGRSVGTAVARNRAKRLLREALRAREAQLPAGWELVLIARAPAARVRLAEVQAAVDAVLRRAGLLVGAQSRAETDV